MTAFGDYFDRAYVINLPERRDRQAEMRQQLEQVGLRLGEQVALFPGIRPAERGHFESIGARGCFLSHLAVLEDAVKRASSRIVLFEDDLNFSRDFPRRIDELLRGLACIPWSIFYGGHRIHGAPLDVTANGLSSVPPATEVVTTHFMAFQGAAIRRVADLLRLFADRPAGDPSGGAMHVDGAYNWYRKLNPGDVALAAVPELGYQRSSRTDVHPLGRIDRTPLLKGTIAKLRGIKNRVASR